MRVLESRRGQIVTPAMHTGPSPNRAVSQFFDYQRGTCHALLIKDAIRAVFGKAGALLSGIGKPALFLEHHLELL